MEKDRVVLDVEEKEHLVPQEKASWSRVSFSQWGVWRICAFILTTILFAAIIVYFTLNKSQSKQEDGSVLRLTSRSHFSKAKFTSKAAIHLTGGYKPNDDTIDWKENQDQAFTSGKLKLVNREIVIPEDGIYFVYSQISFHISCTPALTEDQDTLHLNHAVHRFSDSYGGYRTLFSAIRSVCVQSLDTENLWYNTIYLGAAFYLREGDRLRTYTTTALLPSVESNNGKTFFGAFAL
ncbi:hypothetical protein DNTS_022355 [Danionella cerebrum]|uniref:Lymphotoxin-alpha n=1 Tax=Danionella cerebrum TaxID=2873325 RepID=A0A553QQX1_9TELE|nr:hypothetical protein DNTS_022355 [Danionella translucida]